VFWVSFNLFRIEAKRLLKIVENNEDDEIVKALQALRDNADMRLPAKATLRSVLGRKRKLTEMVMRIRPFEAEELSLLLDVIKRSSVTELGNVVRAFIENPYELHRTIL
tara:strand:+ start:417 stop:743 length:327 start_codon:yes stop_codon:yes gene_type:complete